MASVRETIGEMLGRITPKAGILSRIGLTTSAYSQKAPSIDKSKVDYNLTRAVYYATPITKDGHTYGEDYYLGAIFAKPIVNSTAAFVLGDAPTVSFDSEDKAYKELENAVNKECLQANQALLMDWIMGAYADGDGYIIFEDDGPRLLDPSIVQKIVNNRTGKLEGYDVEYTVEEVDDAGNSAIITYIQKIRKTNETTYRVVDGKETVAKDENGVEMSEEFEGEIPFRVIPYHNEPSPMAVYGNSEFQSCLNLFMNYHAVLKNTIENVMYNASPAPVFEGIENVKEFLQSNFELGANGKYKISWNPNKIIVGGKGLNAKMMQANNVAADASTVLNLIFWGICQTSETPEFVFGTAVASSNASTDSQMPIMIKKAERKRAQFITPLREFIDYWMWNEGLGAEPTVDDDGVIIESEVVGYNIEFNPIAEADLTLNKDIAVALLNAGVITKETAAKLCQIDELVPDIKKEVGMAQKEFDKAMEANAIYSMPVGVDPTVDENGDKKDPIEL